MTRYFYRALVLFAVIGLLSSLSWLGNSLFKDTALSINEFRYTKVNSEGEFLSHEEGPWHCVFDEKTNLMWMVGKDDESPFDSYWSYSWYDNELNVGVPNRGSCFFNAGGCSTQDILTKANQLSLCKASNWRLPTKKELITLVQSPTKVGGANVNNVYFPHTKKGDYWTQEHSRLIENSALEHLKVGAIAVSFKSGKARVLPYRTAAYVKLVSSVSE